MACYLQEICPPRVAVAPGDQKLKMNIVSNEANKLDFRLLENVIPAHTLVIYNLLMNTNEEREGKKMHEFNLNLHRDFMANE